MIIFVLELQELDLVAAMVKKKKIDLALSLAYLGDGLIIITILLVKFCSLHL